MRRPVILLTAALTLLACSGKDPGGVLEAGTSSGTSDFHVWGATSVVRGRTGLLGASRQGDDGDSVLVHATWVSRTPSVASVEGRGPYADVRGLELGRTWIVASTSTSADSVEIAVVETDPSVTDTTTAGSGPVASVVLRPGSYSVAVGDSAGFFAELLDGDGRPLTDRAVTWNVSDVDVAAIEFEYGRYVILRARQAGTVTVTAASEGKSGTASVTVRQ